MRMNNLTYRSNDTIEYALQIRSLRVSNRRDRQDRQDQSPYQIFTRVRGECLEYFESQRDSHSQRQLGTTQNRSSAI